MGMLDTYPHFVITPSSRQAAFAMALEFRRVDSCVVVPVNEQRSCLHGGSQTAGAASQRGCAISGTQLRS